MSAGVYRRRWTRPPRRRWVPTAGVVIPPSPGYGDNSYGTGTYGNRASSGQTVSVGQAVETSTAQPIGKIKTLGQAVESSTAQATAARKSLLVAQAVETTTVETVSPAKRLAAAQVTDTEIAQTVTKLPTVTSVAVVSLASAGIPATRTSHSIKSRVRKTSGTGTVTFSAALYEGATNRSGNLTSGALTTSLANVTLAIPDASAANINDYSNLEVRFWGNSSTGDLTNVELADIWLEAPAAAPVTPELVMALMRR